MNRMIVAIVTGTLVLLATAACSGVSETAGCSERLESLFTVSPSYPVTDPAIGIPDLVLATLPIELPEPSCGFVGGQSQAGEQLVDAAAILVYVGNDEAQLDDIAQRVANAAAQEGFALATESEGVPGETQNFVRRDALKNAQVVTQLVSNDSKVEDLGQVAGQLVLVVRIVTFAT